MPKSFFDVVSNRSIHGLRTLYNKKLNIISTEAQILKFSLDDDYDAYGQQDAYITDNIINNVVIDFTAMDNAEFFLTKNAQGQTRISGVAFSDILPIEMIIPFDVQNLYERDIFTTVFLDDQDNKMPVIWQITQLKGSWRNKHLVKKTATLSLYRENLLPDIEAIITKYVNDYIV